MHKTVIALMLLLILAACAPSEGAVQTAIAQTAQAEPTSTPTKKPRPTMTKRPTKTHMPTRTPGPKKTPRPTITAKPEYCDWGEVTDVKNDLSPLVKKFGEILGHASSKSTPAQYLPLVRDLEEVQNDLDKIKFPPCMEDTDLYLTQSMLMLHESFEAAMEGDLSSASNKIKMCLDYMDQVNVELTELAECLPYCKP